MDFKIVNLSNILPLPDTCSILDPIPWFVKYVTNSRFLTVELSWQTHLSLHQRVDYASRHDDEDSKSFDLQLATSPPVLQVKKWWFAAFHFDCFCQLTEFWQLSCWTVAKFSYSCLAIVFWFSSFLWNVWQVVTFEGMFNYLQKIKEAIQGKATEFIIN